MILPVLMVPHLGSSTPQTTGLPENLDGHQFSDVRVVRPDASPHYREVIQKVTIHPDFDLDSPWCRWRDPKALPCSGQWWEEPQNRVTEKKVTHPDLPLL